MDLHLGKSRSFVAPAESPLTALPVDCCFPLLYCRTVLHDHITLLHWPEPALERFAERLLDTALDAGLESTDVVYFKDAGERVRQRALGCRHGDHGVQNLQDSLHLHPPGLVSPLFRLSCYSC